MKYLWKDPKSGETIEHDHPSDPPKKGWVRVYSFGIGRVEGGGGSPGRVSKHG